MPSAVPEPYMGKFRYLTRGAKPVPSKEAYLLPSLSEFGDVTMLPLTDMRPSLELGDDSPYKLSVHGFTARRHHSALHSAPYTPASWNNTRLLREVYFPEVQELVQRVTQCKKVVVSAAVLRSALYSEGSSGDSEANGEEGEPNEADEQVFPFIFGNSKKDTVSPAPKVHLDLTPRGARYHIRKYHHQVTSAADKVIEKENQLLESGVQWDNLKDFYHAKAEGDGCGEGIPRFALFSVWRPIEPVHRDPLALSSCASFPKSDYVVSEQREPMDPEIPARLSRVIDTHNRHNTPGTNGEDDGKTFKSFGYLAYGPQDEGKTSHDWHFISEQQPSDVLLIQLFDNEMEANARAPLEESHGADKKPSSLGVGGAVHSAFELSGQDNDAAARESIEVRCAAFW